MDFVTWGSGVQISKGQVLLSCNPSILMYVQRKTKFCDSLDMEVYNIGHYQDNIDSDIEDGGNKR